MNILISNDDGPEAEGLALLRKAAVKAYPGSKIVTLVPELGRGGQSLSITPMAQEELKIKRLEADFYVLEGTPADAVYSGSFRSRSI